MTIIKKILNMTFLLFVLTTLYCFVAFKLGYDTLFLEEYELHIPEIIERLIYFIIYVFQIFMIFSYTCGLYDKRIIKMLCAYIPCFVLAIFIYGALTSLILPMLNSFVGVIVFKSDKKRFIKLWSTLLIYQAIVILIKTGMFYFGYNNIPTNLHLIINIDITLFVMLFYLTGGVNYGRIFEMVNRRFWYDRLCRIFIEENTVTPVCDEEAELIDEFKQLKGMERLISRIRLLVYYALSWTLVLLAGKLGNVLIEVTVILVAFICYRFIIPRHWHSNSLIGCVVSSIVIFYIAAKVSIPFTYSQFFPIIIGFIVLFSLFKLGVLIDENEIAKSQKDLERISVVEKEIEKAYSDIDKIL